MEAYCAIVSKRDTRAYTSKPIPAKVLQRILQAGRMAGSAKNIQPVRLIVVREAERKAALAACGKFAPHVPACQVAVAVVLLPEQKSGAFAIYRGPFDAGRAAQNIMVAAWAEGVASCPASLHDFVAARKVLGLPDGHVVANVIALGYPDESGEARESRPRLGLDEIVRWERW